MVVREVQPLVLLQAFLVSLQEFLLLVVAVALVGTRGLSKHHSRAPPVQLAAEQLSSEPWLSSME